MYGVFLPTHLRVGPSMGIVTCQGWVIYEGYEKGYKKGIKKGISSFHPGCSNSPT